MIIFISINYTVILGQQQKSIYMRNPFSLSIRVQSLSHKLCSVKRDTPAALPY